MSLNTFSRKGAGAEYFGYEGSSLTKGTDENKVAKLSSGKAAVGSANTPILGVIGNIDDNGDATIQKRGYAADVPYTSTAPTAGAYNNLECGASGAVQIDDTNGVPFWVDSVDTDAETCVIFLG